MEMIITGRRIDVHEAERFGLVNQIVPKGEALARAKQLAHESTSLNSPAQRRSMSSTQCSTWSRSTPDQR